MSKKLFMGFALALALVGCSQEEELVNMSGEPLKDLTGEIVEAGSRTYLGSDGSVLWSEGDAISLFKKNGYHQKYTVREYNTSSTNFDYAGVSVNLNYTNNLHYAVYPFSEGHSISGSTLTLDLSSLATQSYTENTFENERAVMVAKSANTQLAFTNAYSLAEVQLKGQVNNVEGDDIFVKKIEISSATKALAGTATLNMTEEKPIAVFNDNGPKTITLNCGTNPKLTETATNFYILMPVFTFPDKDLTLKIYATVAGEAKEYAYNLPQSEFIRSKKTTLQVPTINLEDWTGTTEPTPTNVNNVLEANEALKDNISVNIANATGTTESTPITVPAKTEVSAAAKEHTIDLSDATMPTDGTPVYIKVEEGDASNHTVETLKVIVPEDTTPSNFTINAPGTTVTLTTAAGTVIGTIIAETADETLVISSGITVNKVQVKKGNVKLEAGAVVNAIERDDNNKDAATYVIYEGNTKPTITINDEYIILVPAAELENCMVAKIGDKKYLSLQKAVEAVQNGETIVVLKDIKQKDGVLITDKNLTIDLNDKTFTVTEGASTNNRNLKINGSSVVTIMNGTMVAAGEYSSGAYGTVRTEGTANVTLEDVKLYNYRGNGLNVKALSGTTVTISDSEVYSQYGGGIEAAGGIIELNNVTIDQKGVYSGAAWCSVAIGVNGGGKVTVNSGNYSASAISTDSNAAQGTWAAYVMSSGGTLEINGGTFNGTVAETASAANACGLICADAKAVVNIKGGTFNSNGAILDMRNNTGGTPNPKAILTGGTFSADPRVSGLYSSNLIQIAEGYKVVDNSPVWNVVVDPAAKIGSTEYATLQEAFNVGGEITLLRDVTLTETAVLAAGKTAILNLNSKTISHSDAINKYAIANLGTLTINGNGFVNSRGIYNGYDGTNTVATAVLTIENGTFNAKGTNGGAAVYNYGFVEIKGGSFTSIGGYSLNNQTGAKMTIADGVKANNGVYVTGAELIVNGGEIEGNRSGCHVVYSWNSNVTINGGTIHNNNSGNSTLMAAGTSTMTVNGGTFSIKDGRVPGNNNTWTSCLTDTQNSAEMTVNGGTFNGGFRVQAGTTMTINGGSFNDCYGSAYNIYGTAKVKGGTYTDDTAKNFAKKYMQDGYKIEENANGTLSVVADNGTEITISTQIK